MLNEARCYRICTLFILCGKKTFFPLQVSLQAPCTYPYRMLT
uniref:Uncharacterized protein n=1 Tax=Arundo donax TaxID=35708 RepID=A0A0A9F8I5_ARUDO